MTKRILKPKNEFFGGGEDVTGNGKIERADWVGFVNYSLDSSEKIQIVDEVLPTFDLVGFLSDAAMRGYSVSAQWDTNADCYQVSVQGKHKGFTNAGKAVSFRHAALDVAFAAAFFVVVLVYGWGEWADNKSASFNW